MCNAINTIYWYTFNESELHRRKSTAILQLTFASQGKYICYNRMLGLVECQAILVYF